MPDYWPRVVDAELDAELAALGAVTIDGPKACGKTSTAARVAASTVRLDVDPGARALASAAPEVLLDGPTPRLLDEWQLAPEVWDAVRRAVDDRGTPGQFVLTGSATPADDARRHSGAGRFGHVRMRPMSLWESGLSSGDVSLAGLFTGAEVVGRTDLDVSDYVDAIVRGGWPQTRTTTIVAAQRFVRGYLVDIVERDLPASEGRRRDPARLRRFLQAYAQVTAQTASVAAIGRRVTPDSPGGPALKWETADAYRTAAERSFLVEDLPAWSPRLRSRTRLIDTPKRHLVDPSLAASLLGADPGRLRTDGETLGFLFESLVTRDVRVYAQAGGAEVWHYRDRGGELEIDLVVERTDGSWLGIEVKLGGPSVDSGAEALLRVARDRVERPPAALMVVTTRGYAYRRPDGVYVVPLGALRP